MDTLKSLLTKATTWVESNPADVVYIAALLAGFAIIAPGSRRR